MGIARRWRVGMAFLIALVSIPGSLAVSAESDPAARPLPAGSTGVTVVDFAAFKRSELFKNLAPLPDGEQMSVWGERSPSRWQDVCQTAAQRSRRERGGRGGNQGLPLAGCPGFRRIPPVLRIHSGGGRRG